MNTHLYKNLKSILAASLALGCVTASNLAQAEADWFSYTMDNDSFIGNDNGYTNGMYVTWIDTPDNDKPEVGFLARAMKWSLPNNPSAREFDIKTIGQTMITPDDIEEDPPILPPDDLPYGGLLFYTDSFVTVNPRHADRIAVTIGVVGEYSFAEEAQEIVHEIINSEEPCCWDSQLDDEVVFQISRGRIWRTWVSDGGSADLLLGADLELGTISSSAAATIVVRYGDQMGETYATTLLANSRTANPFAVQAGWYVYAGLRAGYLANHIFLDESRSYDDDFEEIDYDDSTLGYSVGLAYSWKDWSLTFALNDLNADNSDDDAEEFTEFGTITVAWKTF
jgi:hypothetical protein